MQVIMTDEPMSRSDLLPRESIHCSAGIVKITLMTESQSSESVGCLPPRTPVARREVVFSSRPMLEKMVLVVSWIRHPGGGPLQNSGLFLRPSLTYGA